MDAPAVTESVHVHEPEQSVERAAHDILAAKPLPGGVVVIDLGGQYAQLIARRVREHGTFSSVVGHGASIDSIRSLEPCAVILSGGPSSVYEAGAPTVSSELWDLEVPILGICYGMQLMARELGGEVARTETAEYGRTVLRLRGTPADGSLFAGTPATQDSWMSHRDAVVRAPEGTAVLASTDGTPIAAFADPAGQRVAVQFHPEVVHTEFGTRILENFLDRLDATNAAWTPERFIELQTEAIRAAVGDRRVLCALSGGVDSSVAAALVHRAVGDQLICVFVDNGLLRAGESAQVMTTFGDDRGLGIRVIRVDAREHFLAQLAGVEDPEEKRKRIGAAFIHVFDQQATDLGDIDLLVQGTLYSDVIESGGGTGGAAATIKSHHNVGGLPDDMQFSLLEPLRMLFKDEVRHVGAALGLPEAMVWRQPFPGPGLAIRIIGEVTAERLAIVRAADTVVREEIAAAGLERELWQSFAVLPAIRSVGVQGDARTYAYPIVIRAVTSDDAMTADWARLPYEVIERLSARLMNEVDGVNRVVLDVSSKPPSTIEWE